TARKAPAATIATQWTPCRSRERAMAKWRSAWLLVAVALGASATAQVHGAGGERPALHGGGPRREASHAQDEERPRAREAGVVIGVLPTGPRNAIVDVPGVAVGHATLVEGDAIRTGATAILPHPGDLYRERVPAAIVVGNGYGKLVGATQVDELGELETPILLTGTLGVWRAADALVEWQLAQAGMQDVRSL